MRWERERMSKITRKVGKWRKRQNTGRKGVLPLLSKIVTYLQLPWTGNLRFKPWRELAGRRGIKERRNSLSKRQRDSKRQGCSCVADVPVTSSTWWLPQTGHPSALPCAHPWQMCLVHREMHVIPLQQRRPGFGSRTLLKCLLKRRGSEN